MAQLRNDLVKGYLHGIILNGKSLLNERAVLVNAAARIAEIDATILELAADGQLALDYWNALEGTSYTLIDLYNMWNA